MESSPLNWCRTRLLQELRAINQQWSATFVGTINDRFDVLWEKLLVLYPILITKSRAIREAVRMAIQIQLSNVIVESYSDITIHSITDNIKISNLMIDIIALAKSIRYIQLTYSNKLANKSQRPIILPTRAL